MVSVTDGGAGHHELSADRLAERAAAKRPRSAAVIGATSEVWDFPDGELLPTLEVRAAGDPRDPQLRAGSVS